MFLLEIGTTIDIGQHPDERFHPQVMNQALLSFALEIRGLAKNSSNPRSTDWI
jgi:hypothetical protein